MILKLIRPITTSLCVPCITTWKHLTLLIWVNVADFIFWLLHIRNLLTLSLLTPLCLPCTPFVDCAHLSTDCDNTYGDYTNFFVDCAHNSDDCANTLNDWVNTAIDSTDTLDISSLHLCIPNCALLQLLFISKSKINTMFTIESMICFLSSTSFISGFYISHPSLSSFVLEFTFWTPLALCSQYIGIYCSFFWTLDSMYL